MATEWQNLLQPATLLQIAANPASLTNYLEPEVVWGGIKIGLLIIFGLYTLFALASWIHVRRLENWLGRLKVYKFSRYALIHFILAAIGWLLALVWL
jgi:hypothetical protein